MEFLTTKQKKQKARRLFIAYGLFSILVVLATYILVSTALGFDLFKGRDVVQNGLLFIDSRPDNADVYLNGKKEADGTNAKYSLPESVYEVTIAKNGYRDWKGTVDVVGGTVEFLTYPRLMPVVPRVLISQSHVSAPESTQSRDKQWLATVVKEVPNQIVVYNLGNPLDLARTITIPGVLVGDKPIAATKVIEWAGDNDHFLVKMTLADTAEVRYALLHRDKPNEVLDISALFPISAQDEVGLWNGKRDLLYIRRETGAVFSANTKDKSLSAASLVGDNVLEFLPVSDDRALYTTVLDNQLLVKLLVKDKTYTVASTSILDKEVLMKKFGFNRNDYILIGGAGFEKTYLYRNFEKSISSSTNGRVAPFLTIPQQSTVVDVSRNNRFIMGSDTQNVAVYDIEQRDLHRYEIPVTRPAELGWFDDVRLYARGSDDRLSIMDFDGNNLFELGVSTFGIPYANSDVSAVAYQTNADGAIRTNFLDIETATISN